jgi:hypothetical protein
VQRQHASRTVTEEGHAQFVTVGTDDRPFNLPHQAETPRGKPAANILSCNSAVRLRSSLPLSNALISVLAVFDFSI